MKTKHALLLSFLILTYLNSTSSTTCNVDDESGLLAFKSGITADPSGILSSWKQGTDCCTWSGITCRDNRVTSIYLTGQLDKPNDYLTGTISPSLSKLRYLDGLYLLNLRNVYGPFPSFLSRLPGLMFIYIENNKLSGPLPENIGNFTQLYALSLEGNRFTGKIPSSVSRLSQLSQLKLTGNFFTGTIPVGLRQLVNLNMLSLDNNRLSGTVPEIFSSFTDLRILRLSQNNFSGKFPVTISSLAPKLSYLELGHNALTGKIPDFLGKFKTLDTLNLSSNFFSGIVPKTFANLTKIFNLDLSNNYLIDPFPALKVKGIESLDLSNNKFHLGKIPDWVASSPIIFSLKLANCGIKMKLDDWKPTTTYFYDYIDLSGNEITGSPIGLLNQTDYLVSFKASKNQLKFDLGKLRIVPTLKDLDLSRNLVFGKVPATVSGLTKLNVSNNHLCGRLPATKFPASAFLGNDCLCGSPLSPCKV